MSRKEASALFQEGIVNAKSLLSASKDRVATALRINVPFRPVDRTSGQPGNKGVMGWQHRWDDDQCRLLVPRKYKALCFGAGEGCVVVMWW